MTKTNVSTKIKLFLVLIALGVLALVPLHSVSADSGAATIHFKIGTDFLAPPAFPPNISRAANGDTVEITGDGTFTLHPKSVTGSGTFAHKNAAGDVLATGTWEAKQLLSYHSYGPADPSLGLPEGFEGGRAHILVHLSPNGDGPGLDAVMMVDCALGTHIPGGAIEGARLAVKGALNFNKIQSGATIFIRD